LPDLRANFPFQATQRDFLGASVQPSHNVYFTQMTSRQLFLLCWHLDLRIQNSQISIIIIIIIIIITSCVIGWLVAQTTGGIEMPLSTVISYKMPKLRVLSRTINSRLNHFWFFSFFDRHTTVVWINISVTVKVVDATDRPRRLHFLLPNVIGLIIIIAHQWVYNSSVWDAVLLFNPEFVICQNWIRDMYISWIHFIISRIQFMISWIEFMIS